MINTFQNQATTYVPKVGHPCLKMFTHEDFFSWINDHKHKSLLLQKIRLKSSLLSSATVMVIGLAELMIALKPLWVHYLRFEPYVFTSPRVAFHNFPSLRLSLGLHHRMYEPCLLSRSDWYLASVVLPFWNLWPVVFSNTIAFLIQSIVYFNSRNKTPREKNI